MTLKKYHDEILMSRIYRDDINSFNDEVNKSPITIV